MIFMLDVAQNPESSTSVASPFSSHQYNSSSTAKKQNDQDSHTSDYSRIIRILSKKNEIRYINLLKFFLNIYINIYKYLPVNTGALYKVSLYLSLAVKARILNLYAVPG